MDHATIFLFGVFLLPLAFVSGVSAWARNHRPTLALVLAVIGAALIGFVAYDRPEGVFPLSEIPVMVTHVIAQIMTIY